MPPNRTRQGATIWQIRAPAPALLRAVLELLGVGVGALVDEVLGRGLLALADRRGRRVDVLARGSLRLVLGALGLGVRAVGALYGLLELAQRRRDVRSCELSERLR